MREIGYGIQNTQRLFNAMGYSTYSEEEGSAMTTDTAFNAALDYSVTKYGTTFSDWFLPSYYEMQKMNSRLDNNGLGNFNNMNSNSSYYWTSSEGGGADNAIVFTFLLDGRGGTIPRSYPCLVRPIMRFMD